MQNTIFYFIRHGESVYNVRGLINGQIDTELTKKGISQTKKIAKSLKKIKFDVIYTSDLKRARDTTKIIAQMVNMKFTLSKLLRERNFGPFEGKPRISLKQIDYVYDTLSEDEKYTHKLFQNMESDKDLYLRIIKFIEILNHNCNGKTILVVTHGGIMAVLLNKLGSSSYKKPIKIDNLGYFIVEYNKQKLRLRKISNSISQEKI